MFEGAGSALSDGSAFFARIGAVVYSYNQNEINLWYPGAGDYLIFIGGTWGYGAPTQQSTTASVSVKVFKADSILPGKLRVILVTQEFPIEIKNQIIKKKPDDNVLRRANFLKIDEYNKTDHCTENIGKV